MSDTVIELKNVKKQYGKFEVLKGVNMNVKKGDIYGLIGQNGAGKTTIFKLILGLSDYNEGNISIMGSDNKSDIQLNRHKIGFFVGANFFAYLSGQENLKYYCRLKGLDYKKEVPRVLGIVGLNDRAAKAAVKKYSMGMKQRLGIAIALLGNPDIIILDEPTNGLDPQGIVDIRELIKRLNNSGKTIIVSSHILAELENTAHKFGIVHQGVIKKELSAKEIFEASGVSSIEIADADMDKAKKVLGENGIGIRKISKSSTTLEEFYFGLVNKK